MQPISALYTDLSAYYDLMCCDINYQAQSDGVRRIHQIFGNGGKNHLDLACGTGPHMRHFIDAGYRSTGLDLNQPMLNLAKARCPQADFTQGNMCNFTLPQPVDLITCFLYSIHYSQNIELLSQCIQHVYMALNVGGVFCFNAVDKDKICNKTAVRHSILHDNHHFEFESGWHYPGNGNSQALNLRISRTAAKQTDHWHDQHAMVAVSFTELAALLAPWFELHILAHDYDKVVPCNTDSGNAIFVGIKL